MANLHTNRQAARSNVDYKDAKGFSWGTLCSEFGCGSFTVVKVFNATSGSGHCYSKGGPAEWLTVINGEVVGSEPTKRRARLIGTAIQEGHIEKTGDTGARLDSYLIAMAVWNYEGSTPSILQQREIDALLKD